MMFKSVVLLFLLSFTSVSVFAENIPTRFGQLEIQDRTTLLYQGLPLTPEIQGNVSLSVEGVYQIGNRDIVLIQDNGGTACPALLYVVSLSQNGVEATAAFGSCSDLIETEQVADSIYISMPGFVGRFEPEDAQLKAAEEIHVFIFKDGVLTESKIPAR